MLQVRFAEVSRSAVTELGSTFFTGANGYKDVLARTTTEQNPGPAFTKEGLVFSDFLNVFLFDAKHQLGTVIKALQREGQFRASPSRTSCRKAGRKRAFSPAESFRSRSRKALGHQRGDYSA